MLEETEEDARDTTYVWNYPLRKRIFPTPRNQPETMGKWCKLMDKIDIMQKPYNWEWNELTCLFFFSPS